MMGTVLDYNSLGIVKSTIGLSTLCGTAFCNQKAILFPLPSKT